MPKAIQKKIMKIDSFNLNNIVTNKYELTLLTPSNIDSDIKTTYNDIKISKNIIKVDRVKIQTNYETMLLQQRFIALGILSW